MNITPTTYYTVMIVVGGIILVIMLLMVIFMMESLATLVTDQVDSCNIINGYPEAARGSYASGKHIF